MKRPGKIVSWTTKEGQPKLGIAYMDKQVKGRSEIMIDLVDENHQPIMITKDGKKTLALTFKRPEDLKIIGFVN